MNGCCNPTITILLKRLTRSLSLISLAVSLTSCGGVSVGLSSESETARFYLDCLFYGEFSQMELDIRTEARGFVVWGSQTNPQIRVVIGSSSHNYSTQGYLASPFGYYTFDGSNEFANFIDRQLSQRFLVEWRNSQSGFTLVTNPFQPNAFPHPCEVRASVFL